MEEVVRHHLDWIFILLCASGGVLVWTKISFPYRFSEISSITKQVLKRLDSTFERSKNGLFELFSTINFYLLVTLLILLISWHYNNRAIVFSDWFVYLQLLLVIALLSSLQNLATKAFARIFEIDREADWYASHINSFRMSTGVSLFPLLLLAVYARPLNTFFLFIGLLYFMFMFGKSLFLAIRIISSYGTVSLPRIFLYLCALEIAPIIWVVFWFF